MSIASEIQRLQTAKSDIKNAIEDKGVEVPANAKLDEYADYVEVISGGVNELIARTISEYTNSSVSAIGPYAFAYYSSLRAVSFPACISIGSNAFYYCSGLADVNFLACTSIGSSAFYYCSNLSDVNFPVCTFIGGYAFFRCNSLAEANFPACTSIGSYAFSSCSSLTEANFPACTSIGSSAFLYCSNLTTISFPACTSIGTSAFEMCSKLTEASFPVCKSIGNYAFAFCRNLISLYLTSITTVPTLGGESVFYSSPIGGYSASAGQYGSVFVPASLYSQFLTATYWSFISSRIVSV